MHDRRSAGRIRDGADRTLTVEYPFRYVKQVFGYAKLRYRGLHKNTQRRALLLGFTNHDDQAHAPNESLVLANYEGGARTIARYWEALGVDSTDGRDSIGGLGRP